MSNQVATVENHNPFARQSSDQHISIGTVAIESERAIAEAQGKLLLAKRFPRNQALAYQRVMESCSRPSFAAVAEYAYPRGKEVVRGPSIRLAEEISRCWGNLDYGIRELSRKDGVSEMEAYCWDLETNTTSSQKFTVRHIRDLNSGAKALTSERDIYEMTANQGGRRLRSRILAILPPDLVEAAMDKCRDTLAGNASEPISDRVRKMLDRFAQYGVTAAHLTQYLNKSLDEILPTDIADLAGIYNSIKTGTADASDFFGFQESARASDLNAKLKASAANATAQQTAPTEWPKSNTDGELIDVRGIPWDERIHAGTKSCNADGTWRFRRGADPELAAKIEGEALKALASSDLTEDGGDEPEQEPEDGLSDFEKIKRGLASAADESEIAEWLDYSREVVINQSQRYALEAITDERRRQLKTPG